MGISGGRRKKKERKKGDTVRKPSGSWFSKKEAQRYARCRDSQSLCREVCYASLRHANIVYVCCELTKIDRFGSLDACNGQGLEYSVRTV